MQVFARHALSAEIAMYLAGICVMRLGPGCVDLVLLGTGPGYHQNTSLANKSLRKSIVALDDAPKAKHHEDVSWIALAPSARKHGWSSTFGQRGHLAPTLIMFQRSQVFSMIIAMRSPTACNMPPGTATRRRRKNPMKHDWNGTPNSVPTAMLSTPNGERVGPICVCGGGTSVPSPSVGLQQIPCAITTSKK